MAQTMAGSHRLTATTGHQTDSESSNTGSTFEDFFSLAGFYYRESGELCSSVDQLLRGQCEFLVKRLEIAVQSCALTFERLSVRERASVSLSNWKLLVQLALDVNIFIRSCVKAVGWIWAASMLMNSFEHVALLTRRLELCTWSNRNRFVKGIMLGTDLRRVLTKISVIQDRRFRELPDVGVVNPSSFRIRCMNSLNRTSGELDSAELGVKDLVNELRKRLVLALRTESASDRERRQLATSQVEKLVAALVDYPLPDKSGDLAATAVREHVQILLSKVKAALDSESESDLEERQLAVSLLRGLEGALVINSTRNIKSVLTIKDVKATTMTYAMKVMNGVHCREPIVSSHSDRVLVHRLLEPLLEKLNVAPVQGAKMSHLAIHNKMEKAYSDVLDVAYFEKPDLAKLGIHCQLNIITNTVGAVVNSSIKSNVEWDELLHWNRTASLQAEDLKLSMCLLVGLETILADIPIPDELGLAKNHSVVPSRRRKSANLGFRDAIKILLEKLEAALGPGHGSISNTKERYIAISLQKQLRAVLINNPSVWDEANILLSKAKTASRSGSLSNSDERELAASVLGELEAAMAVDLMPGNSLPTSVRDQANILLERVRASLSSEIFPNNRERQFTTSLLSGLETALASNPALDKPDLAQLSDRDQDTFAAVLSSERISKRDGVELGNVPVEKEYRRAASILGGLEAALVNNPIPEKPNLATLCFGDQENLLKEVKDLVSSSNSNSIEHQVATSLAGRLRTAMENVEAHLPVVKAESKSLERGESLGRGSGGEVFAAEWLGTRVAVKLLKVDASNAESSDKVPTELSILAALSHPNIVQLLCYVKEEEEEECNYYIVLELMDKDLSKLIRERMELDEKSESPLGSPFPVDEAVDLILQIAQGMEYLHRKKVCYRDLKPENILIKCKKLEKIGAEFIYAKVADFGESKRRDRTTTKNHPTWNTGTSRYIAPELIRMTKRNGCEPCTGDAHQEWKPFKSDVYSFGMVCYEILTGEHPFMGVESSITIKQDVLKGKRPSIPSRCPILLRSMIQKCWRQEFMERPSFTEVCSELTFMKGALLIGRDL